MANAPQASRQLLRPSFQHAAQPSPGAVPWPVALHLGRDTWVRPLQRKPARHRHRHHARISASLENKKGDTEGRGRALPIIFVGRGGHSHRYHARVDASLGTGQGAEVCVCGGGASHHHFAPALRPSPACLIVRVREVVCAFTHLRDPDACAQKYAAGHPDPQRRCQGRKELRGHRPSVACVTKEW